MAKTKKEKKRENMFYKWVGAVLTNDESSTDKEMKSYFKKEGKMNEKEAKCYIEQRDKALSKPLQFELKKCRRR